MRVPQLIRSRAVRAFRREAPPSSEGFLSFDRSFRIIDANLGAAAALGKGSGQLIGGNLSEMVSKDDLEKLQNVCAALSNGQKDESTVDIALGDQLMEFKVMHGPHRRIFVAFIKAATQDVGSNQAAERMAWLVENSDDAILATDTEGIITDWNIGAANHFGYTAAEVVGSSVAILTPPDRAGVLPDVISAATSPGRVHHYDTALLRKDGSVSTMAITISPLLDREARVLGASIIAKDNTIRHRAENAIHDAFLKEKAAAAKEREAAEHLRMLDSMKDEFLSTVAHEMKTPLSLVIGFAETLLAHSDRLDDLARGELLKKISYHAAEGNRMIQQLLDLTRLEAGIELRPSRVSLQEVIRENLDRLASLLHSRPVTTALPELEIEVDLHGFERILSNLLVNAAKYSPEGSPIGVIAREVDGSVEVSVQDSGPGIAEEDRNRVFRQFYRGKQKGGHAPAGSGLGLSIARRYVELHGGKIWVEGAPGQGAVFTFTIPTTADPEVSA